MRVRLAARLAMLAMWTVACTEAPPLPPPPLEGETEIVVGTGFPLESEIFSEPRTINVYLPTGYRERSESFPVLYLVDGGVHQDFHPMSGMAALASLTGQYREFILVGVRTNDRYYELTAPSDLPADVERIAKNGGAADFRRHLLEEVKPFVEGRFRTSGEDAVIGESLAGLFITETFLRAPNSFDHYVAVSPSLWWRDMGLSRDAADLLKAGDSAAERSFYLTIADEGGPMHEGVDLVVAALEDHAPKGLTWWYDPMPQETHSTIYNPASLRALRRIFARD